VEATWQQSKKKREEESGEITQRNCDVPEGTRANSVEKQEERKGQGRERKKER
jgi:hypothetical protein